MGFDFYAPQTFEDAKGRRILIGWMGMTDADEEYTNPTAKEENWQHCLTVPREVTMKNGMLYQWPVEELNTLRGDFKELTDKKTEAEADGPFDLEACVQGDKITVRLGENLWVEYTEGKASLHLSEAAGFGRKVRNAVLPSGKPEAECKG